MTSKRFEALFILRPCLLIQKVEKENSILISLLFLGNGFVERFRTPIPKVEDLISGNGSSYGIFRQMNTFKIRDLRTGELKDELELEKGDWSYLPNGSILKKQKDALYLISQKGSQLRKKKLFSAWNSKSEFPFWMPNSKTFLVDDLDGNFTILRKRKNGTTEEKLLNSDYYNPDMFVPIITPSSNELVMVVTHNGLDMILTWAYEKSKEFKITSQKELIFNDTHESGDHNKLHSGTIVDSDTFILRTTYGTILWSNSLQQKILSIDDDKGNIESIPNSRLVVQISEDDNPIKIFHWHKNNLKLIYTFNPSTKHASYALVPVTRAQIRCYAKFLPSEIPMSLREEVVKFCIEDW
jgi:hypothetical protein